MLTKIKIVLGVIAVAAIIAVPILTRKLLEKSRQINEMSTYVVNKDKEIEYYKNVAGKEVAKKESVIMALDAFKKISKEQDLKFLEEFEGLKKSLRNLEAVTDINTQTVSELKGGLSDTTVVVDNVPVESFTFDLQDEWVRNKGIVIPSLAHIEIETSVEVPIQGVIYWERAKLFGWGPRWFTKKHYITELTSPNPHTKITKTNQLLIRRK